MQSRAICASLRFLVLSLATGTGQLDGWPQQAIRHDVAEASIVLSSADPLVAAVPSPMIEGQLGCTVDGALVVHSILDMDLEQPHPPSNPMVLNVISPDGSEQAFDLNKADDIEATQDSRSYDVGREVLFLVYAAPKLAPPGTSIYQGKTLRVLRFDRGGKYLGNKAVEFPSFAVQGIAGFDSGEMLLFGVDKTTNRPHLARFSPVGNQLSFYQADSPFASTNKTLTSSFSGYIHPDSTEAEAANAAAAVQYSQYVHYKDSILLLQMNAGAPLFQVFGNGSINTIKLPATGGFSADSLVPSDTSIYVRYRRVGTNSGRGDDAFILELSSSGDVLRKLHPSDFTIWDVVCARGNDFKVVKMKSDQEFQFFTAHLGTEAR